MGQFCPIICLCWFPKYQYSLVSAFFQDLLVMCSSTANCSMLLGVSWSPCHIAFASMRCFAKYEQNMGERSAMSEPHRSCYVSRARNEARVQRGRSEAKKSFFLSLLFFCREIFHYFRKFNFFRFDFFQEGSGVNWKNQNTLFFCY